MRTGLTIGFTKDGSAEIISGPEVPVNEQRRAFNDLAAKKGKFTEVQYWESGRGLQRRKRFAAGGEVNFNASHSVESQRDSSKKKKGSPKLEDLTPTQGEKGGVNFNAAHRVRDQKAAQKKKGAKNTLPDLTPDEGSGKGGVNFDAAKPVREQRGEAPRGKKRGSRKTAANKTVSRKRSSSAGNEASHDSPNHEPAPAQAEGSAEHEDGDPSL